MFYRSVTCSQLFMGIAMPPALPRIDVFSPDEWYPLGNKLLSKSFLMRDYLFIASFYDNGRCTKPSYTERVYYDIINSNAISPKIVYSILKSLIEEFWFWENKQDYRMRKTFWAIATLSEHIAPTEWEDFLLAFLNKVVKGKPEENQLLL